LLDGQDLASVAILKIPLPPSSVVPAQTTEVAFGDAIELEGHTLSPNANGLDIILFWKASDVPQADYTIFIHLVADDGQIAAQVDAEPLEGQYPTSIWSLGETVVDRRFVPALSGEYQVYVGLYQWQTLERLPALFRGKRLPDDRFSLGSIRVP
jgi:hypothetical protein